MPEKCLKAPHKMAETTVTKLVVSKEKVFFYFLEEFCKIFHQL